MDTGSLLGLVMARSVRILLEWFLVVNFIILMCPAYKVALQSEKSWIRHCHQPKTIF